MANMWSRKMAVEIYGNVLGNHFYDKYLYEGGETPDQGVMRLFYDMTFDNLQLLINKALDYYA